MTQQTSGTFAVIGSDGVFVSDGRRFRMPDFQQLAYWLDQAQHRNIDTLWLHPSAGFGWLDNDIDECANWEVGGRGGEQQGDPYWTARKRGVYGLRSLVQTRYEDRLERWPGDPSWRNSPDARSLRDSLLHFREVIGFDWWRGPGANGTRLLRQLHSGAHATKLELDGPAPRPATEKQVCDNGHLYWTRAPREEEKHWYLHGYDVNAQYLAACNSLALPVGQWTHHTRTALPEKPAAWPAGYYRVRVAEKVKGGPCPSTLPSTLEWVTTPTLRLLSEFGAQIHIVESYTWNSTKQYLQPWQKTLRDARTTLARDPVALAAVKAMYRHTVTWFASDGKAQSWDRSEDTLYRPDWYHLATAQARAGVLRTVYRTGLNFDVWPVGVGSDSLYYLSPSPDPIGPYVTPICDGRMNPTDGVRLSPSPGHHHVKDAAVPFAEVEQFIRGRNWNLNALQAYLNERSGRKAA